MKQGAKHLCFDHHVTEIVHRIGDELDFPRLTVKAHMIAAFDVHPRPVE